MTNEEIAIARFISGEKPTYSTGICGSITCGYGELDANGYWEFPLYNIESEENNND